MFGSKTVAPNPHINRRSRYETRPSRYKRRNASDQKLFFGVQVGVLVAISLSTGIILAILF